MELLEGQTLKRLIEQRSLEIERVIDLAIEIVDALDIDERRRPAHEDARVYL